MIYIRDDDVLLPSSGHPDPFRRFRKIHRWIAESDDFLHIPTILVTEIQDFPTCIKYIKEETAKGKMRPEIHGLRHIDYGKLTKIEVKEDLEKCKDFIFETFGNNPKCWYTPWGASQPHLHEVAEGCGLKLVDCSDLLKLVGRHGICRRLMDGESVDNFHGLEIFSHWWDGGMRIKRVVEAVKHGSWKNAAKATPELFE